MERPASVNAAVGLVHDEIGISRRDIVGRTRHEHPAGRQRLQEIMNLPDIFEPHGANALVHIAVHHGADPSVAEDLDEHDTLSSAVDDMDAVDRRSRR